MPKQRGGKQRGPWLDQEPGRPSWYIYWYESDSGRVGRRSTRTADRSEAERRLGEFLIERSGKAKPGPIATPDRYMIATALRWYGQERAPELGSASDAGRIIVTLTSFFDRTTVAEITPQLLKRYAAQRVALPRRALKEGEAAPKPVPVSRGTIRRELSVLSAVLGHAVKNGRLTSRPPIALPPPGAHRERFLDEAEIRALLAECRDEHLRLFVLIALNTGGRRGAILDLEWRQVDFAGRIIHLNPPDRDQTSKRRASVPISATLYDALVQAHGKARTPFVVEYHGEKVADVKRSFAAACARAGIEGVSPHTLRRTAGTLMAKAGIDLFLIARMLGHSVQKTTELYAIHSPTWLRQAADVLGRATKL